MDVVHLFPDSCLEVGPLICVFSQIIFSAFVWDSGCKVPVQQRCQGGTFHRPSDEKPQPPSRRPKCLAPTAQPLRTSLHTWDSTPTHLVGLPLSHWVWSANQTTRSRITLPILVSFKQDSKQSSFWVALAQQVPVGMERWIKRLGKHGEHLFSKKGIQEHNGIQGFQNGPNRTNC